MRSRRPPTLGTDGSRRFSVAAAALVLAALVSTPLPAAACSICRCGDPTFNALGTEVYSAGRFRVALDFDRFDKTQGTFEGEARAAHAAHAAEDAPAEQEARETMTEHRTTAVLAYTFGDRVTAVARLPYSSRRIEEGGVADETRGLSDPELYGLVKLWSAPFAPGLGSRAWVSLMGGVKTDWGRNDLAEGGVRRDEHAQPGTGSRDPFGGLSGFYLLDSRSSLFASAQRRWTGVNGAGYRYGALTLANAGYERKLGKIVDGVLELNFRRAGRDDIGGGVLDPNTGGDVLYLTPRINLDLGRGVVGRASAQIPVSRKLNGDQEEKAVLSLGLTYLF
jgi:hypothetical protein